MKTLLCSIALFILVSACGQDPFANQRSTKAGQNSSALSNCIPTRGLVCGQPPMPNCADGMVCAMVMPEPVTYQNDCALVAARASYLQDGECPTPSL
jgi:hypothetical protein